MLTNVVLNNVSSCSQISDSQFRLSLAVSLHYFIARPHAPSLLPQCSLDALSMFPRRSLAAPPYSLTAPSKAALLPFPIEKGNLKS